MANGYNINGINALGSDPMFLAALQAYNPNFRGAQQVQTTQTPQTVTTPQVASTQTQALPKADYSESSDSSTGMVVGLTTMAVGAASLIYAAKKGDGNIINGFKKIFKSKNPVKEVAETVAGKTKKTAPLENIRVMMKGGKPVYYIPGKTTTASTPAEIKKLVQGNTKLERQLKSLRFSTGETNITAGTFTLKDGGNANTIIFKGDKIEDILNASGKSIKDKFLENGKIKSDLTEVSDNAFARRIEEYIEKIKQGDTDIIRGQDTNLRDFTYTTKIGDSTAEVFRKGVAKGGNAEIKKLTTLKEFKSNDDEVLAYVRTARENGHNVDSIIGKDFLSKGKVPDGYKVHEFTLSDNGNVIKIVDGKVEGITISGKYYSKDTDKCKAYLERNNRSETINKMIDKKLKDNNIPAGATIIPV